MSKYAGIEQATGQSKHPFHNEVGTFVVELVSWSCPQSRRPGPTLGQYMDIVEWKVVKCVSGDASCVDSTRVRIRPTAQMGAMDEIKARAQVVNTVAARAMGAGATFEFPMKDVTPTLLDGITDNNGRQFVGLLFKIEVSPPSIGKVSGKPFTPISYAIPTASDLSGLNVVNGRLAS